MTIYASRLGPNDCKTVSIGGRSILVSSEGDVQLNVGDSGAYIHQRSFGKHIGLYEVDGRGGGFKEVAEVEGGEEWFAGFSVDWDNGETPQGNFTDELLVVSATDSWGAKPSFSSGSAYDHLTGSSNEVDKELTSTIDRGIADSYCRGDNGSVKIRVSNESICKTIDASLNITYELTGETESINLTNDFTDIDDIKRLNSVTVEPSFTIPEDSPLGQQDILTIDITSSDAINDISPITFSTFVGSNPDNLSLKSISDIDGVCSGDRLSPDVVAVNSSNCPASLGVEITNDQTDDIISADPTSVPTGDAQAGTNSYFINLDVPDVSASVSEITYTVNLTLAGQVVDTETFTVSVSQPELSLGVFETPNQACSGDDIRMSIEAQNSGGCDGSGRAIITNNINDEVIETSSSSLRAGSSRSIRAEDTIPPASSDKGAITYTATLQDSAGNDVAQETSTINIGSVDISLQNFEFPDDVCAGQSVDGEVEVTNNGECSSDVTVSLAQESTGETEALETVSLRDGSSRTIRFSTDIPLETIKLNEDTFTLSSQVPGPDSNIVTDTLQTTSNIASTDVGIVGVSAPSDACVGTAVDVTFNVENAGQCDGEYRVLATDSVSQNEQVVKRAEIRGQRRDNATLKDTMPVQAIQQGGIVYSYEVQSNIAGTFDTVDTGEVTVGANTSELTFGNVSIPDEQCIGTSVNFEVPFQNVGECDTEYRIVSNNVTKGERRVIEAGNINADSSTTVRFDDEITSELANSDVVTYDINLQKRLNQDADWQTAKDIQTSVDILKPDVSITSANYPDFTSPGEKQNEIEVTNSSSCATNVDITISGKTTNLDISPQSTRTITDSFTVLADEVAREISLNDNLLDSEVDSSRFTIRPHKFINVNQSQGVLEIKGGFDEEALYSGTLLATAVSEGDNLEEKDSAFGALGANSIQGTATTESNDKDTIKYGALKGINIQISETATIVVDGEIRGTSKSYRHSTVTSSLAQFNDNEQPQIETISGPVSNLGAIRKRLNTGTTVLSGPIFTIDR